MAKQFMHRRGILFSGSESNRLGKIAAAMHTLQQSRCTAETVSDVTHVCFHTAGVRNMCAVDV